MSEARFDFQSYQLDDQLTANVCNALRAWYIVRSVRWAGDVLVVDVSAQYGSGYESMTAFIDGLRLGLKPRKVVRGKLVSQKRAA